MSTYVVAQENPNAKEIRVLCLTSYGPRLCEGIFERLGYTVRIDEVEELEA